jgi:cytochrome d ubiquinol oxidase subunit I
VGRQPYIVFGVLRTDDAVTRAPGIWVTFTVVVLIYALLTVATFLVLRSMTRRWRLADEGVEDQDVPYGPARRLDDEAGDALATR